MDHQLDLVMRGLQSLLPSQNISLWLMQGAVSADEFGCYRPELSVALTKEGDNRIVHELARLTDRAETPAGYDHLYNNWDGGAELGPEYDENEVL